ncbi:helix-turn-helix domain-containing protein [Azorhizobium doebereinerae]|uniref:helix-turn-helix domain-containing protein n=1 Tax=Azorhizobium doebereinerae TaxID=281091 RepID=UPI000A05EA09|nr:helix-turn-helix domain-containing protein [Azorhizobium doebereinerae]
MRQKRWDKHDIKAEVTRRRGTLTSVATSAGLEPSACRVALCRRNLKGEQALAAFLGVDLAVLWPERYPVTTSKAKSSASSSGATSQIARRDADMGAAA